jgi:hypothetical protein
MGELRNSSTVLNLDTICRCMVSFTPLPLYPRGKSPWYSLGGPQSRSGCYEEEKNLLSLAGIELRILGRQSRILSAILTKPKSIRPVKSVSTKSTFRFWGRRNSFGSVVRAAESDVTYPKKSNQYVCDVFHSVAKYCHVV